MAADPPLTTVSHSLAERIRDGDAAAFEAFFRAEYASVCGFLRSRVGTAAIAEELAQDVMLRLWHARNRLEPDSSLRGYLYRSARNAAVNHNRRVARETRWAARAARASEPALAGADESARSAELAVAVDAAIAALPERCRLIFLMSRNQHLTHTEIAEALDISRKTVETQIGRALEKLRRRLAPFLD